MRACKLSGAAFAVMAVCVGAAFWLATVALETDHAAEPGENAERLLSRLIADGETPGVQYVVVDRHGVVYEFHGGLADVAAGRVVDRNTTFLTYSLTKTFTAAAALKLHDGGKLDLDDRVIDHLPYVPYGRDVRIRHLLTQTSGIPNPIPLRWVHLADDHDVFDHQAALLQALAANDQLLFAPGERYAYSNISYWLLGEVVERAAGRPFAAYFSEEIFTPLGVEADQAGFDAPQKENHAAGYLPRWSWMNLIRPFLTDASVWRDYEGSWLRLNDHHVDGPGFGGLVASANAVATFLQDQLQQESAILSPTAQARFHEPQSGRDGPIPMTLGWHIGDLDDVGYLFKSGGGPGYRAEMRLYPESGLASVILTNNGALDVGAALNQLDWGWIQGRLGR